MQFKSYREKRSDFSLDLKGAILYPLYPLLVLILVLVGVLDCEYWKSSSRGKRSRAV